jgi:hypothetical protein
VCVESDRGVWLQIDKDGNNNHLGAHDIRGDALPWWCRSIGASSASHRGLCGAHERVR